MKPVPLTKEELDVVTNCESGDIIILEIIKGMSVDEMKSFDVYTPIDRKHYTNIQINWLIAEKYLLYNRPSNIDHSEVSEELLLEDLEKNHNGERFKVFYVLRYPNKIKRIIE